MNGWLVAAAAGAGYYLWRRRALPAGGAELAAAAAIGLASRRYQIATSSLRVRRIEAEVWPDASLGLPSADQQFAAVATPGYRVEVETLGGLGLAEYHCDAGGRCGFCPPCSARLIAGSA